MVALTGALLLWAVLRVAGAVRPNGAALLPAESPRAGVLPGVAALIGAALIVAAGTAVPGINAPTGDRTVNVALVQGNVPRVGEPGSPVKLT
jgi:apolipoprotein N-acyltransferase